MASRALVQVPPLPLAAASIRTVLPLAVSLEVSISNI